MEVKRVRVGIVGAGYVSAYHVRALKTLPYVDVVGIADSDIVRARQVAEQFKIPAAFSSLAEMGSLRLDVVHVLTPPATHCALTLEALAMGCHVFVEKPMATTREECDRMIEAARAANRGLSVNHSARFDPIVLQALELVRRGVCGDVLSVDFCRSSDYPLYAGGPLPAPYRDGGYPFQDIGTHGLYLLESFLGRIKTADVRYRSTGRNPNVYFDDWRGTVECEKGVGHMFLSWATRPLRNELFVHGTKGYLHVDCFLQTCTVHKSLPGPKAISGSISATTHAVGALYKVPRNMLRFVTGKLRPSPGIHAGVIEFHEALHRGMPPPVTAEEGQSIVSLTEDVCQRADRDRIAAFRVHEQLPRADVLVTGAAGLLGRALLDRLRGNGQTIRILVRQPSARLKDVENLQVVYGDLGDPAAVDRAVAGVDVVYHVGATMRGRGWGDFQAGTVVGTQNVVESCLKHHVTKMVYVSSLTVLDYAGQRSGAVVTEDAPLEPRPMERGAYTQSKLQAEQIVREAIEKRALPGVILRPGTIFGPGAETIPPYGTIAVAGRWLVIGSGKVKLPLVYVDDVVDGLVAAASSGVHGAVFQLVDPTAVTQDEYIAMCQRVLGNRVRVVHAAKSLLYLAGAALELVGHVLHRSVPLSRYRVGSIKELRFECGKAGRDLAWRPIVGVNSGLAATFQQKQATQPAPLVG